MRSKFCKFELWDKTIVFDVPNDPTFYKLKQLMDYYSNFTFNLDKLLAINFIF